MLTTEEQQFLKYWETKRLQKGRGFQFTLGLPLGVLIVFALFINILTGWHKRAAMVINSDASLIIVVLVAAIAIVIFITAFSKKYQREQKEQRYLELIAKRDALENTKNSSDN